MVGNNKYRPQFGGRISPDILIPRIELLTRVIDGGNGWWSCIKWRKYIILISSSFITNSTSFLYWICFWEQMLWIRHTMRMQSRIVDYNWGTVTSKFIQIQKWTDLQRPLFKRLFLNKEEFIFRHIILFLQIFSFVVLIPINIITVF